jgi:hypothetical protein
MSSSINIKEILPRVLLVNIKDQYTLCMTFIRIQEFYESPQFKGKYFTLEDYMDWYCSVPTLGNGSFTYPSDWDGMNFDGVTLKKWLHTCIKNKDQLRNKELKLINSIEKYIGDIDNIDQYYIIGTTNNNGSTIQHEIAHAFYSLYPEYKKRCDELIDLFPVSFVKKCRDIIIESGGYCVEVFKDEFQAYLSTSNYIYNRNIYSIVCSDKLQDKVRSIRNKLEENLKMFKKELTK